MGNIFIQNIEIKNIRQLKNILIEIDDNKKKHLILTGKNGSGKTTVLNAIRSFLISIEENEFKNRINAYKCCDDYKYRIENYGSQKNGVIESSPKVLKGFLELKEDYIKKYGDGIELEIGNNSEFQEKYDKGEIILAYFGSKRGMRISIPKGIEKVELKNQYTMESEPSQEILKYLVDLKAQQAFARYEEENEYEEIDEWFTKFENLLRFLMDDPNLKFKFDYKNYNFEIIEENKQPYGFSDLSDGYSAVLDIVSDLMLRMERKSSKLYNLEGIVLIDEIETHLHIDLQKKIMPFLIGFFPNVQFIVTTHSPFVINSTENAIIYDLEKNIRVDDLSAYSYQSIVERYFNVDQYSSEIKSKITRYEQLVYNITKTDDDLEEMYDLRKYFKNLPEYISPELSAKFLELEILRRTNDFND